MNPQVRLQKKSNALIRRLGYATLLCSSIFYTSCQKEEQKLVSPVQTGATDPALQSLLNLGYQKEHIQEMGEYFLVDEDLFIEKKSLTSPNVGLNNPGGRTGQYVGLNRWILGYVQQAAISVRIDESAAQWNVEIRDAVRFWNDLDEARINFYITDGNTADIVIRGVAAPGQTIGEPQQGAFGASTLPLNGIPANWVDLNNQPGGLPAWRARTTIVHELGHAVGFQHSDLIGLLDTPYRIHGTPERDDRSIFNSGGAANRNNEAEHTNAAGWPGFSYWDRVSIQTLYPEDYTGDRVYEGDFYSYGYPDVVNAYGGNPTAIREHFGHTGGPVEGRVGSPLFEVDFYRTTHPDLSAAGMTRGQAITHWLGTGSNEGRASSSIFDVQFYLANNPDIAAAFGTRGFQKAYHHWVTTGIREGRAASPNFNVGTYLGRYPDVRAAFGTNFRAATFHWFFYGKREGRVGI